MIVIGDSLRVMAAMKPESVDAIVTDPPYGLSDYRKAAKVARGFMGKEWDGFRTPPEFQRWTEEWARAALHVLKPGGYLIAFASDRTFHRVWCGIEDAGFELRPSLAWWHGSGFPKSMDLAKAIDWGLGAVRAAPALEGTTGDVYGEGINVNFRERPRSAPVTDEAKAWDGWGTALKPGYEPICMARKPFVGPLWRNVLKHGTGALNIDGCRLARAPGDRTEYGVNGDEQSRPGYGGYGANVYEPASGGRWPANVILSHSMGCRRNRQSDFHVTEGSTGYADQDGLETVEAWACEPGCPVRILDEQSGSSASSGGRAAQVGLQGFRGQEKAVLDCQPGYGDVGGASRFRYIAKASTAERESWGRIRDLIKTEPGAMVGRDPANVGTANPRAGGGRLSEQDREAAWVNAVHEAAAQGDTGALLERVIEGFSTVGAFGWNTTSSGRKPTDRSQMDTTFTTGTETSSTTNSEISSSLTSSRISESTADALSKMESGLSRADFVASVNRLMRRIGISAELTATSLSTDGAARVISERLSEINRNGGVALSNRSRRVNTHVTVKPLDLMAWLVRLVTPPGGLVLDPFAGSGTTLVAARREGFRGLGIELDPESARIAQARIRAQWEVKLL